jgi:hypothetical protein
MTDTPERVDHYKLAGEALQRAEVAAGSWDEKRHDTLLAIAHALMSVKLSVDELHSDVSSIVLGPDSQGGIGGVQDHLRDIENKLPNRASLSRLTDK